MFPYLPPFHEGPANRALKEDMVHCVKHSLFCSMVILQFVLGDKSIIPPQRQSRRARGNGDVQRHNVLNYSPLHPIIDQLCRRPKKSKSPTLSGFVKYDYPFKYTQNVRILFYYIQIGKILFFGLFKGFQGFLAFFSVFWGFQRF